MSTSAKSYRRPMLVSQIRVFKTLGAYPVCPRCHISLGREYQRFCDRCGQRLCWDNYAKSLVVITKSSG